MLIEFQKKYGLTNRQAALLCGCSLATVQKWRSGNVSLPAVVVRFLAVLDAAYNGNKACLMDFVKEAADPDAGGGVSADCLQQFADTTVRSACVCEISKNGRIPTENYLRYEHERSLQDAAVGFWQWDIRSGVMQYDAAWASTLGFRPEEVGSNIEFWKTRIHPDDFDRAMEKFDGCRRGQESSYEVEFRIQHTNESWIWVLNRGTVFARDANGVPVRLAGTQIDITRYKDSGFFEQTSGNEALGILSDEWLADISYQLRTPMNCIIGAEQALNSERYDELHMAMMDVIRRSGCEMMRLIDALEGFSAAGRLQNKKGGAYRLGSPGEVQALIAEDNPAGLAVLNAMLLRLGVTTAHARNGMEAVLAASRQAFDFIFMDIEMPVMNGVDAVQEIRRREKEEARTPAFICAATAYAMPGDREKYLAEGMDGYLSKPITLAALADMIQQRNPAERNEK